MAMLLFSIVFSYCLDISSLLHVFFYSKGNCNSNLYCELNSIIYVQFGHYGEGENMILSKLVGEWTDCQGIMCHLSFSSKQIGGKTYSYLNL